MFTEKTLNLSATPLSFEITFSVSEYNLTALKVFPVSTSIIPVRKFTFPSKRGFTFLQKV